MRDLLLDPLIAKNAMNGAQRMKQAEDCADQREGYAKLV
jgi:hypothetical protein